MKAKKIRYLMLAVCLAVIGGGLGAMAILPTEAIFAMLLLGARISFLVCGLGCCALAVIALVEALRC